MPINGLGRRAGVAVAVLLWPPGSAAAAAAPVGVPVSVAPVTRTEVRLVDFDADADLRCDDGAVHPLSALDVTPTLTTVFRGARPTGEGVQTAPLPVVEPTFDYTFDVDGLGRVRSLRNAGPGRPGMVNSVYVNDGQLAPALAAWPFPTQAPHTGCHVHVRARLPPLADAGRERLLRAFALGAVGPAQQEWREHALPGSDCYDGEPLHGRVQHYVPVDEMHESPGHRSWSVVVFDVAADGRTRNVAVASSSGQSDLDTAAVDVMRRSRYAPQAKRQCAFRFYTSPGRLEPEWPARVTNGKDGPCQVDPKLTFAFAPAYPPLFRARSIEGYALVRFDTAPWGAIGAVRVLKSEPAEAFGDAAKAAVQSAHVEPSPQGAHDCLQPMRFRIDAAHPEGAYESPPSRPVH